MYIVDVWIAVIADMMAGVGPFAVPLAMANLHRDKNTSRSNPFSITVHANG